MLVSVVVPVYNREDVFATVGFLRSQAYAVGLHFVVIDNGNNAGLSCRIKALEGDDCEVISFDENRGGSAAYIAGVERAMGRGGWIWLLDDDAKPNADTLPGLVSEMERLAAGNPKTATVGSCVLGEDGKIIECGSIFSVFLGHAFQQLNGRRIEDAGRTTLKVSYSPACSLLVNPEAVRACGFWEDVFIHFDDIEWGVRLSKNGWGNYATTLSTVVHPPFNPEKAGPWISYFDARNQYWFASKFGLLHIVMARVKNLIKDVRDGLYSKRSQYRRLAWEDFKANRRRTRAEAIAAVEGGI